MTTDFYLLFYLAIFVLILTLSAEWLVRRALLPQWLSRKLLHVGAVGACAVAPALLQDLTGLTVIVALVEPILLFLVGTGRLFSEANGRRSWGIALFPLAYLVLLLLFAGQRWLIVLPMAIMAWSDAAAAIAGQLWAKRFYTLTGDRKSLIGSCAFVASVPLVFGLTYKIFPAIFVEISSLNAPFWLGLLGIAILIAALEALGSNGFDNVWVPLGAAFLLHSFTNSVNNFIIISLWIGILAAVLFSIYTIRKKALTLDGAVVASLLGLWVLWFAGAKWLIPLFFFFITSTLIGRLNKKRSAAGDVKQGKARDYVQVLCNGGIYAVLATFAYHVDNNLIFTLMLVSMAICTADTWSSEIGIYFRWKTYDLLRERRVMPGLSGGVSVPGTLGGLAGAMAMAVVSILLLKMDFIFIIIAISGFVGMIADSLMGASLQARYQNVITHEWSDNAAEHAILQSGWRWMTNDAVNFWSNFLVTGIAAIFLLLYLYNE